MKREKVKSVKVSRRAPVVSVGVSEPNIIITIDGVEYPVNRYDPMEELKTALKAAGCDVQ